MSARPMAVVTGAARRVGAAIAEGLADDGFDLLLTRRRSRDELEAVADRCRRRGAEVDLCACDFADPDEVAELGRRLAALPRLDALVHNASSYDPTPLGSVTDADAVRHYRVNAVAPLLLTQAAAPRLRGSDLAGGGAVVCFGDIHVMGRPRRNYLAYGASKAALGHLVEALARELAPEARVVGIAPGVVAWPEDVSPAERAAYEARIPLARPGTPEDAASMVRWLVREATYVTGEIIRLDGGRWLT